MKYLLALLAFLALPAFAEISGSATISDDYHFRGISQNAGDPALSAEVTATAGALFGSIFRLILRNTSAVCSVAGIGKGKASEPSVRHQGG